MTHYRTTRPLWKDVGLRILDWFFLLVTVAFYVFLFYFVYLGVFA